jgi:hypothetical protein
MGEYSVNDSFSSEDSLIYDDLFDEFQESDLKGVHRRNARGLDKEVTLLRSENKKLKKMLVLNMFDSKEDLLEFIEDIW